MKRLIATLICATVVLAFAVAPALASDHFGIIVNLANAPKATADIDVSVDASFTGGQPVAIRYTVFRASDGVPIADFQVNTVNNFANNTMSAVLANQNLFTLSGGQTALVRVRTPIPQGSSSTNAVLRQQVAGQGKIILGLPATTNAGGTPLQGGTRIPVAIGNLLQGTFLFIANLSGQTQAVDVFFGESGNFGTGKYSNPQLPPNAVWQVQLQPADANQHCIITSTGNIMAQLAIDDGKIDETMLLPD